MPSGSATESKPAVAEAWGLSDQVEELCGKYLLKKKDGDAYQESSRSEIKRNEKFIRRLRQENRNKHIQVADLENGDERVIRTVFKDDRKELLSLQRFTAVGAKEEMDQTVCQAAKFLNALRYERQKREARLFELQEELERMRHLERASSEQQAVDDKTTSLENALDKANIKYDMASCITRRYRDILDKLREESLKLPAKLDAMEAALLQQKAELTELKSMAKNAHASRDEAKRQLAQIEGEAYESKRQRDAELSATRKEVERRTAESEKCDKRSTRATLLVDTSDQKALQMTKEQEEKQKVLRYEDAFLRIKEAARVTDIKDAVDRVVATRKTQKHLKQQVAGMETLLVRMRTELKRLQQQYHDMKYTGEQKLSRGQRRLEETETLLEEEERKMTRTQDRLRSGSNILVELKTGVLNLLEKLAPIKLHSPEHSFTHGDVFDQLDLCYKKLEKLLQDVGDTSADSKVKAQLRSAEFQEFLEVQVPANNVRVLLAASAGLRSQFDPMDSEETHDFLTRADVKNMGQKLIESKEKPKKRRAKKAK